MAAPELRIGAGPELRVTGRTLSGTVLRYGDVSPSHRERFEPGAFAPVPAVPLNLEHDGGMVVAAPGAFDLRDSPAALEIRAELPPSSAALMLLRRGAVDGFSIEFHARSQRQVDGVRVIDRAELVGVGLVQGPSYGESMAELRARGDRGGRLFTARGFVPKGRTVDCRCAPGNCREALFEDGAFDNVTRDEAREVLAVAGEYQNAIAARSREGLRFWQSDRGLEYAIDVPATARGRALRETMDSVPVYGRPVLDLDRIGLRP